MRIMTINVWGDYYENPVELREDGIYNTIMEYSPDVFGLQEMTPSWHNCRFFEEIKKEYECVEICDYCHVPLYYKKSKFELTECGWERFRDTPDDDKSVTWAVITERETGKKYGFCNTHFWWKIGEEHDKIRVENAEQILTIMKNIKAKYGVPVFAFGDFNSVVDSDAFRYLEENNVYTSLKLTDDYSEIKTVRGYPVLGEDGKFHGLPVEKGAYDSLDHIITFKGEVNIIKQDVVINDEILGSTDHSPVYIDVEIN